MKFGWWRAEPGRLRISGHLVDDPGSQLTAEVSSGYGASGFQPSAVTFPTEGCWRVTATVGSAELSFVTLVIKRSTTTS